MQKVTEHFGDNEQLNAMAIQKRRDEADRKVWRIRWENSSGFSSLPWGKWVKSERDYCCRGSGTAGLSSATSFVRRLFFNNVFSGSGERMIVEAALRACVSISISSLIRIFDRRSCWSSYCQLVPRVVSSSSNTLVDSAWRRGRGGGLDGAGSKFSGEAVSDVSDGMPSGGGRVCGRLRLVNAGRIWHTKKGGNVLRGACGTPPGSERASCGKKDTTTSIG